MLSGTKRNRPRPLRRIRRRTFYPLPFGLDGMAGASRPADCARGRALFSWYVLLLMALYVPAGWVVSRLRGWPCPDRKTTLQGRALSRPVRLGLEPSGGLGLLLLFSGRRRCSPSPSRALPFWPSPFCWPALPPLFMLLTLDLLSGSLRDAGGKRLFQSSAWFAAMFLAGLLPPMLFFWARSCRKSG